ncbi:MAG TPA: YgaP-like transmembrane domain [Phototrophicaceae bacterium]|nr:YgaP-like transmembrane domain [Phototrophicaceae bacterium]
MAFAKFMAGSIGRAVRIIAGVVLIGLGLLVLKDTVGLLLTVVGIVFVLVGVLNVCLIAPLIGAPFSGKAALEK